MTEDTSTRRFALIVANGTYDDERLHRLKAPTEDAEKLARVLEDAAIGGFERVETVVNQGYLAVREAIVDFFHGKKKDDLLLVYFSGHGMRDPDDDHLHLTVKDTDRDKLRARGIASRLITHEMDLSRARRIVLIFDCCYSGAFDRGAKSSPVGTRIDVGAYFRGEGRDEWPGGHGRAVLTASSAVQVAWEGGKILGSPEPASYFTHYLVEGLETGAAGGTSPWITVDALYAYAHQQVAEKTASKQTPQKWIYGQTGELIIARNPRPVAPEVPAPPSRRHHFISYSPVDGEAAALQLYDALQGGPSPLPAWIDRRDVAQPGPAWDQQVETALQGCESLLLVVTPGSVTPGCDCEREWRHALRYKKPIVPLLFDPEVHPPLYLENRDPIPFTGPMGPAVDQLRRHLAWLDTPAGALELLKQRRADARRDLRGAGPTERARIEQEIEQLEKQIAAQQEVVDHPERAAQRTEQKIQSGLERERRPARPVSGARRSRFINPPPAAPPDYFQDRTVELGLLGDFLKDDACRMVTVVGRAGIGKTATACLLLKSLESGRLPSLGALDPAHEGDDGEPLKVDGIVYLSAVGTRRISVTNLYADLCRLLPDGAAAKLEALYRDPHVTTRAKMEALLAAFPRQRVVVLLDNFEDVVDPEAGGLRDDELGKELDEAIRALLDAPHHGVKLVLTTRVAPRDLLLVQPARQARIDLDEGLESPYAENILRAMDRDGSVGLRDAPEELLAEARRRTRGYPRALEALYGILSADRHTILQEVLDAAEHLLPENVVEALVGQAFERIDPTGQQVMEALAVYGRPVTPAAVDFLLQPYLPGVDSAPVLHRLVAMHFARKEGGQYYLHPVDRAYAFQGVPEGRQSDRPEKQPSEIERLLRSLSQGADLELPPEGEAPDSAPVWSRYALLHRGAEYFRRARKPRAEWNTIDDLAPQLAEFDLRCAGGEYGTAFDVLFEITFDYLHLWGHYRLLVDLYEGVQGRLDDRRSEGICLSYLGIAYYSLGQVREAIDYYEEALAISREIGDRHGEGTRLGNLGNAYYSLGQVREAIGYYQEALAISREIGDRRGEGTRLGNLGNAYYSLGQVREAIGYYHEQALAISREIGDRRNEGVWLGNLAELLANEGRCAEAIRHAIRGVQIGKEIDSPNLGSYNNTYLALAHLYAGDLPAARAAAQAACRYDEPGNNHRAQALRGTVALRQGDREAARAAFTAAVAHAGEMLAQTAELYEALDARGHALAGLALCGDPERVAEATAAFRAARAITRAPGIVGRVLRLLDALAVVDAEGLLAPVRAAAAGKGEG